jgi:hypothetical protein
MVEATMEDVYVMGAYKVDVYMVDATIDEMNVFVAVKVFI